MKKIVLLAFVLVLLSMSTLGTRLVVTVSGSTTHHVYSGHSIQDAINSALPGDTIIVHNGTYYEHLVVNKTVSLIGENKYNTIIDGNLTGNVIEVTASNVNISGFTIQKSRWYEYCGIDIGEGSTGNNISYNIITNNTYGIRLTYSSNNVISGNTASNNGHGIVLSYSSGNTVSGNNTLFNNNMTSNTYNFMVRGDADSDFDNSVDVSNTVDGKPVHYLKGVTDTVYDAQTNVGTFYLIKCNNITIKDITLTKNGHGVFLWTTTNSKIENVTASNNINGIYLTYSSGNILSGNTASNNTYGIELSYSSDNTVSGNNVSSNNWAGIDLHYSSKNNIVSGNTASNNSAGIYLYDSHDNTFSGNIVLNNINGIRLDYSGNNLVFHNNFINNTQQAMLTFGTFSYANSWDEGYPSGGNYWSNYTGIDEFSGPYQNLTGSDGIGDTPYVIYDLNQDNYPLMEPFSPAHDIAVTDVTASPESVMVGQTVTIKVIIKNDGDFTETFNVTAYYDSNEIGTQTVANLASAAQETLTFTWNTSGLDVGNYTIKAVATNITGETDTADNTFTNGIVTLKARIEYRLAISIGDWVEYTVEKARDAYFDSRELNVGDKLRFVVEDTYMKKMSIGGEIAFIQEMAICDVYLNDEKIGDDAKNISPNPFWCVGEDYCEDLEDYMEATVGDCDLEIRGDSLILTLTIYGTHEQLTMHKESGVLTKAELSSPQMENQLVLSDTSVTGVITAPPPFWMERWFWIIVVTGIAVLAGAAYFLKKRKPPTPAAPPLPPEGTDTSIR